MSKEALMTAVAAGDVETAVALMGTVAPEDLEAARTVAAEQGHVQLAEAIDHAIAVASGPDLVLRFDQAARSAYAEGEVHKAAEMMLRAVDAGRNTLTMNHGQTLACVSNLAVMLRELGQAEAATDVVGAALEEIETPPVRPIAGQGLVRLSELTATCANLGDPALEARGHRRLVLELELTEQTATANYPAALNNFAEFCRRHGMMDEAAELYSQVLDHAATPPAGKAAVLSNMALLHAHRGERDRAIALLEESISQQVALWGTSHPNVQASMANLQRLQQGG